MHAEYLYAIYSLFGLIQKKHPEGCLYSMIYNRLI